MAFFPMGFDLGYRFCLPPESELRALQMNPLNPLNEYRHITPGTHAAYGPVPVDKLGRRSMNFGGRVGPLSVDTSMLPLNMCKRKSMDGGCTPGSCKTASPKDNSGRDSPADPRPEPAAAKPFKFSIDDILSRKDPQPRTSSGEETTPKRDRDAANEASDDDLSDSGQLTGLDFGEDLESDQLTSGNASRFSWLQCTRYKPPKLPRSKKKDGLKKRKLGRNPRVPFTQHQVGVLEQKFRHTHYLSSVDVAELSAALNLTETRVKIWFQNRRARERRDKESGIQNKLSASSAAAAAAAAASVSQTMSGHHSSSVSASLPPGLQHQLPWTVNPCPTKPGIVGQFPTHRGSAFSPVSLCSFC